MGRAHAPADLGLGRQVFAKTCLACHKMYGEGGDIGPELTGSNRADLDYILAELEYARDLYRGNPEWPVIDVTRRSIEETAAAVIRLFGEREQSDDTAFEGAKPI